MAEATAVVAKPEAAVVNSDMATKALATVPPTSN